MTRDEILMMQVLKGYCLYKDLMDDFEARFCRDHADRCRKYGRKLALGVTEEQWGVFERIHEKYQLGNRLDYGSIPTKGRKKSKGRSNDSAF